MLGGVNQFLEENPYFEATLYRPQRALLSLHMGSFGACGLDMSVAPNASAAAAATSLQR